MAHIWKFIGMYIMTGIVTHIGWTILFEIWIHKKVGGDGFVEAIEHYLALKVKLYDRHAGLHAGRMLLERMMAMDAGGWILVILATLVTWPVALFEDIAVYRPMTDYVHEQCANKSPES